MVKSTIKNNSASGRLSRAAVIAGALAAVLALGSCSFDIELGNVIGGGVDGSGEIVTEEFDLEAINAVEIGTVFNVEIVVGDEQRVEVRADDNLFEHLKIEVNNGTLELDTKSGSSIGKATLLATVMVTQLDALSASGASDVAVSGIDSSDFELDVSGASDLAIAGKIVRLDVNVSGASDVDLSGSVESADIVVDGASDLDFDDSTVGDVEVDLSGASTLSMRQAESVRGSVDGVSTIKVGTDTSVELDTSGLSKIERD